MESNYMKRYQTIREIGWKPFKNWFLERDFRSWWQLSSFAGVPLYKIYITRHGKYKVWNKRSPSDVQKQIALFRRAQSTLHLIKNSKDVFNDERLCNELQASYGLLLEMKNQVLTPLQRIIAPIRNAFLSVIVTCLITYIA